MVYFLIYLLWSAILYYSLRYKSSLQDMKKDYMNHTGTMPSTIKMVISEILLIVMIGIGLPLFLVYINIKNILKG